MGFLRWLKDAGGRVARTPREILGFASHALTVLWHVLRSLGVNVGRTWGELAGTAGSFAHWVDRLAHATYTKLRELVTVTIPDAVAHVLAAAWRRAHAAIHDLATWAREAVKGALHYARTLANEVRDWARSAVRWLTGHIADLLTRVGRLERRVFSLLDAPEHLAAWVFGALWRFGWRYLHTYRVALGRWLLASAVQLALRSARDVEAVLAEII